MSEIDVNTGLPEVPDGQFWRVFGIENLFAGTLLKVQLRRKRFIGSTLVDESVGYPNMNGNPANTARWLAEDLLSSKARVVTTHDRINDIAGDYPPKNLGGTDG